MCPLIVSEGERDYGPPAPAGMHQAVCAHVIDMGEEYSEKYKKWRHTVVLTFEMAEKMDDGRPFMLSVWETLNLGEKSNLRAILVNWRGRPFTPEELKGFDLEKLIGVNATINVIHKAGKGDVVKAKIASVNPPIKGAPKLAIFNKEPPQWFIDKAAENHAASKRRAEAQAGAPVDAPQDDEIAADGLDEVPF